MKISRYTNATVAKMKNKRVSVSRNGDYFTIEVVEKVNKESTQKKSTVSFVVRDVISVNGIILLREDAEALFQTLHQELHNPSNL